MFVNHEKYNAKGHLIDIAQIQNQREESNEEDFDSEEEEEEIDFEKDEDEESQKITNKYVVDFDCLLQRYNR